MTKACETITDRAFTVGNHVALNHGEYDPSSPDGQHVLGHELGPLDADDDRPPKPESDGLHSL
ncbi:hypothetical protein C485_01380 [Natrinema altunense JCM 12890]|uniref:eCIS core domain-containing protein n=1 Tax=Natrinema altunense (strain JCM 12890 / CGMCC 1.3731 / AJ2) TaxID=1227494 RepID=M0A2R2_NATA2|nr:hypothetical protein C485_01380 [Natrinema altunense JCM 12890]